MRPSADPARLAALLAAIRTGDQAALVTLYDLTSPALYAILLQMLRQPEAAQEALQDSFLRIWRGAARFDAQRGDPFGWLVAIARYRALDQLRSQRQDPKRAEDSEERLGELADQGQTPEEFAVEQEGMSRLRRCLDGLREEQRRSVMLAYYEGYSHQQLAEVMQAPLGTVKSWVRSGLMRLRDCLVR